MFLILFTFVMTTALHVALVWFALQRVIRHLERSPEGVKAVTDHVLLPMLGKEDRPARKPEPVKKIEGEGKKKGQLV